MFLTNAVKCRPPNNRTPKRAETRRCFPHVEAELDKVRPELVVVAGNAAMHSMDIAGGITENGGKVYPSKSPNYKAIIPIMHPSAVLHNGRNITHLRRGLESIREYLKSGHTLDLGKYFVVTVE